MQYSRLRTFATRYLDKHPAAKDLARHAEFLLWKSRARLTAPRAAKASEPAKVLTIDPAQVSFMLLRAPGLSDRNHAPPIAPGNWDKEVIPIDHSDTCASLEERYTRSVPWEKTALYQRAERDISTGRTIFSCRTLEEFHQILAGLDYCFEKGNMEGHHVPSTPGGANSWDDIAVAIDRVGRLLLVKGELRLAMATVLRLKDIPATVYLRHTQWNRFRGEVIDYLSISGGKSYQPLLHPDLSSIHSAHGDRRLEIISEQLPVSGGKLLDLGASWGYFAHKFEERGFECVACEISPAHVYFMRKFRDAAGKTFKIIPKSFLGLPPGEHFDVVLALNIFHHLVKHKTSFFQLQRFLSRLEARCLVFEPPIAGSEQMTDAYKNFSPEEFVAFILENSRFTDVKLIGYAEDKRPLYLLQ